MNTRPDDEVLARWLDDELEGGEQAAVEAWAAGEPEWLAHRDQARRSRSLLGAALPSDEPPPSAEFFNARILRQIGREAQAAVPAPRRNRAAWFLPATAAAGMALGFWLGRGGVPAATEVAPPVAELAPVLYTPEKGVKAEYLAADEATVIVLAGVEAIPDDWELPATAALPRESDRTASIPEAR